MDEKKKWTVKDVITTVLLSAVLIVIQLVVNMVCMANDFVSMVLSVGITMFLCAPVYMLMVSRIGKLQHPKEKRNQHILHALHGMCEQPPRRGKPSVFHRPAYAFQLRPHGGEEAKNHKKPENERGGHTEAG